MKRILLYATTLLFIGCGSATDSAGNGENTTETIAMSSAEIYQVYPGDHVNKLSPDTQLLITHNDGEEGSSIELLQGSAEIIRPI